MKLTRGTIAGSYLCENKTGKTVVFLEKKVTQKELKSLPAFDLIVGLAVTDWSEVQLTELFRAGMPTVYETGEYEAGDMVVNAHKQDTLTYAMISIDRAMVAYVAGQPSDGWSTEDIGEADVVVGSPAAVAKVYSKINAEHVILFGSEGLDEFKQITGVSEFIEGKSVKLAIKPGQELMGIATKVYVL